METLSLSVNSSQVTAASEGGYLFMGGGGGGQYASPRFFPKSLVPGPLQGDPQS